MQLRAQTRRETCFVQIICGYCYGNFAVVVFILGRENGACDRIEKECAKNTSFEILITLDGASSEQCGSM